jgi:hypothetical protein
MAFPGRRLCFFFLEENIILFFSFLSYEQAPKPQGSLAMGHTPSEITLLSFLLSETEYSRRQSPTGCVMQIPGSGAPLFASFSGKRRNNWHNSFSGELAPVNSS